MSAPVQHSTAKIHQDNAADSYATARNRLECYLLTRSPIVAREYRQWAAIAAGDALAARIAMGVEE